jgi:ThiF family
MPTSDDLTGKRTSPDSFVTHDDESGAGDRQLTRGHARVPHRTSPRLNVSVLVRGRLRQRHRTITQPARCRLVPFVRREASRGFERVCIVQLGPSVEVERLRPGDVLRTRLGFQCFVHLRAKRLFGAFRRRLDRVAHGEGSGRARVALAGNSRHQCTRVRTPTRLGEGTQLDVPTCRALGLARGVCHRDDGERSLFVAVAIEVHRVRPRFARLHALRRGHRCGVDRYGLVGREDGDEKESSANDDPSHAAKLATGLAPAMRSGQPRSVMCSVQHSRGVCSRGATMKALLDTRLPDTTQWRPALFHLGREEDATRLEEIVRAGAVLFVHDTLDAQLRELVSLREPSRKLTTAEADERVRAHLAAQPLDTYGVWAHYPWSGRLVHVLPEDEHRIVRTDRNRYKITRPEQQQLARARIGVLGLSVGNAAAVTFALEGVGGSFRLADFDHLSLSNLNRLRGGVQDLGVKKTVLAAREMFEIDPYLEIECFSDGVDDTSLTRFLGDGAGKLDVLVEECDDLYMKVVVRERARALGIPVVMDTSDRGLLDVERFDL